MSTYNFLFAQVHFIRPVSEECLHSAELRDIVQFSYSNTSVSIEMRVTGVFQFETKQGKEICAAANEKRMLELSKFLEESENKANQLQEDVRGKQMQELKMKEELENVKGRLRFLEEIISERDKLRKLCDGKDSALQATILEKQNLEARFAKSKNNIIKEFVEANNQKLNMQRPLAELPNSGPTSGGSPIIEPLAELTNSRPTSCGSPIIEDDTSVSSSEWVPSVKRRKGIDNRKRSNKFCSCDRSSTCKTKRCRCIHIIKGSCNMLCKCASKSLNRK